MARKLTERDLQSHICYWVRQWGGYVFVHDSVGIWDTNRSSFRKSHSPFRVPGVADILGIWSGDPLAIEVKIRRGKQSEKQIEFANLWTQHGGIYILAYSLQDVMEALGIDKSLGPQDYEL